MTAFKPPCASYVGALGAPATSRGFGRVPVLAKVFACLLLLVLPVAKGGPARPNLLVILVDDQGVGDVSASGEPDVRMPHVDRIGAEGMMFTSVRANVTVCSPSRAALLTGRYPDRVGGPGVIRSNPADSWGYLDPQVPTLADVLAGAGYGTALTGKWHLGLASPSTPNERGFAHLHGFLGDMMDNYTTHRRHGLNLMRLGAEEIDPVGHATDLFSDWAVAYLRQRALSPDRPFLLVLAYNAPHFPIEPPAVWLERLTHRCLGIDEKRAKNVAFVEHVDAGIGRVPAAVDGAGLADNTMVVFSSDDGGSLPHGQSNSPWRGGKQDHYDGGLRVPFLVRWRDRHDLAVTHRQKFEEFAAAVRLHVQRGGSTPWQSPEDRSFP